MIKMTDLRLKTKEVINKIINNKLVAIIVSRSEPQVVIQPLEEYRNKEKEIIDLKRKVFELECIQAQKEIEENKISGPFKSGNMLIESLKDND